VTTLSIIHSVVSPILRVLRSKEEEARPFMSYDGSHRAIERARALPPTERLSDIGR